MEIARINNISFRIPEHNNWTPEKLVIENGQLVYPEERFRIENYKPCSNAIISFRDWRARIEKSNKNIAASDIPKEYADLIAVLIHESDESLSALTSRINDLLSPFERRKEANPMFTKAIKQIIKVTAYQERYGLADTATLSAGVPPSIPKRLYFFRWQVQDTTIIPTDVLTIAAKRRDKRKTFSSVLTNTIQELTVDKRKAIFDEATGSFVLDPCQPKTKSTVKDEGKLFVNSFFASIKEDEYTTCAPYTSVPKKKICPSFHTVLHLGLNETDNFKSKFLSELPFTSREKRGIQYREERPLDVMNLILSDKRTRNEEAVMRNLKLKLLHFHENVRPAYYGTWTKAFTKTNICGKKPLTKDTSALNYDEDSEAEWDHDVDTDDIHTLGFYSDSDLFLFSSAEEDDGEEPINIEEEEEEEEPIELEGRLPEDEGVHLRRRKRTNHRVMSRPARWPILGNKHFPMKPVIIGPSFEKANEPENHPLSDFKAHFLHTYSHMNPFDELLSEEEDSNEKGSDTLNICVEPTNEFKPPLFQREVDKIINSTKQELIQIILDNKSKTMMGLVSVLKTKKNFHEYTTAQIQAMIHDLAVQEIRGLNKEYNWYLRT